MASIRITEEARQSNLLYIGFNQDYGCFACGTETGFRIYNCKPFKKTCQHDFPPKGDELGGGIGIVEMLFRCNLLALVGGGKNPRFPPNKVMIWDDHQKKCIGEVKLPRECKAVKMRRDRIIAATENKIYIFRFSDLEMLDFIETCTNPKGLFALCPNSSDMVLACPGLIQGHVRVEHQLKATRRSTFIPAHDSDLEALALNFAGSRLATASNRGTLIRIYETREGQKLQELRRGVDRAIIHSLCFDAMSKNLACSSDKGTVHVFGLRDVSSSAAMSSMSSTMSSAAAAAGGGAPKGAKATATPTKVAENATSSLSFMKGILPKYFSSEWSFAQMRLSSSSSVCAFSGSANEFVVVSADGKFQRFLIDHDTGKCTKTDYHELQRPIVEDDDYEFPNVSMATQS